jgi:hypothetical protein
VWDVNKCKIDKIKGEKKKSVWVVSEDTAGDAKGTKKYVCKHMCVCR